jgi:EmrB/QacA subfamily drug resistance transporter
LCGLSNDLHVLVACRILQGCGGAMMVPVGRLTLVHVFPKSELVRAMSFVAIPALVGPMIGPLAGGILVSLFHWRVIFFVNIPIGLLGLFLVHRHLPDYRAAHTDRLDWVGMILFGAAVALLSYVLEIFGEHRLSSLEACALAAIAAAMLVVYLRHATRAEHPLLDPSLFRIRTFRAAVVGNFVTRLGAGGLPFLLPLLYQVGLGYTPIQSGLLILPQSIAAIGLRMIVPKILTRLGYRRVFLSNTVLLGLVMALFATIGPTTPALVICIPAAAFGFVASLQFTSMNTLVYADIDEAHTSMASTIVSTMQQMSMSFGVATASLTAALFIPDRAHATRSYITHGIHLAILVLAGLTVLSALVFAELHQEDGESVSRHKMASALE